MRGRAWLPRTAVSTGRIVPDRGPVRAGIARAAGGDGPEAGDAGKDVPGPPMPPRERDDASARVW